MLSSLSLSCASPSLSCLTPFSFLRSISPHIHLFISAMLLSLFYHPLSFSSFCSVPCSTQTVSILCFLRPLLIHLFLTHANVFFVSLCLSPWHSSSLSLYPTYSASSILLCPALSSLPCLKRREDKGISSGTFGNDSTHWVLFCPLQVGSQFYTYFCILCFYFFLNFFYIPFKISIHL